MAGLEAPEEVLAQMTTPPSEREATEPRQPIMTVVMVFRVPQVLTVRVVVVAVLVETGRPAPAQTVAMGVLVLVRQLPERPCFMVVAGGAAAGQAAVQEVRVLVVLDEVGQAQGLLQLLPTEVAAVVQQEPMAITEVMVVMV